MSKKTAIQNPTTIATDGHGTALLGFQKLLLTGSDVFYGSDNSLWFVKVRPCMAQP